MKNVKSNYKVNGFIIFLLTFIITMICSIFFTNFAGDEMWNYGFSLMISKGKVIYRDFSCLQMPLYFFINSIFIFIFGKYLYSSYILYSFITGIISLLLYRLIGKRFLIILPLLLLVIIPSYNYLCILFLLLIIYIYKYYDNFKYRDLLISFIVGLTFITKQNAGLFLLIPCLYYSKNRIKSIICFLLPFLFLSLYLYINDAFMQFIDYCFLGMIDFNSNKQFVLPFVIIEAIMFIYLIYKFIKSDFKDREVAYVFMFNLLIYPLVELYHFIICFIPFMYIVLRDIRKKYIIFYIVVFLCFMGYIYYKNYHSFYNNKDFMYGVGAYWFKDYLDECNNIIDKYDKYDRKFYIVINSFPFKLYRNEDITKYDLLLEGNMGYHGSDKYIKEIDNICSKESCVFFIGFFPDLERSQFSKKIYEYAINSCDTAHGNSYLNVCIKR